MTPTEEVLARYKETASETDSLGRVIKIRRMRPSQNMMIMRLADSNIDAVITNYLVAASVTEINGIVYSFPQSIGEAGAVLDVLSREGMRAASLAYVKLNKIGDDDSKGAPTDGD